MYLSEAPADPVALAAAVTQLRGVDRLLRAALEELQGAGSKHLGALHWGEPDIERKFIDQFHAVLEASQVWRSHASAALRDASTYTPVSVLELAKLGSGLEYQVRTFNRRVWWASPTKAALWIKAPFQVATRVMNQIALGVLVVGETALKAGASIASTAGFLSGYAGPLLIGGVLLYIGLPWMLAQAKAAR